MINDHDFFKISKKSNDILDKNNKDIIQSISKLHVIKHHSAYFSKFKRKKKLQLCKKFLNFIKNFFLERRKYYFKNIKQTDCVIISNIVNNSKNKKYEDIYFGDLKLLLSDEDISTIKIYRNLTNKDSQTLSKSHEFKEDIILSKTTYIVKELTYLAKTIYSFFNLKIFGNNEFIKKNFNFLDFLTIPNNLRFRDQVCELVFAIKPKLIIFTFEGHAWERILISKLKKISPNTIIAGYQFTGLIKNQNSIYRKVKSEFKPDIIFTTGKITKKIIQNNIDNMQIEIMGSSKNFKINDNQNKLKKNNQDNFLFVPEGTEYEMEEMLNFCIILAEKFTKKKFRFRFHPLIDIKKFLNENSFTEKLEKLNNIIVSDQDLDTDILISEYIIFRGSSVVFNAILNDKTPIYLNTDQIYCNPLYEVFPEKLIINNKNVFENLNKFKISDDERTMLKNYCMQYFEKLNPKIIKKFLEVSTISK